MLVSISVESIQACPSRNKARYRVIVLLNIGLSTVKFHHCTFFARKRYITQLFAIFINHLRRRWRRKSVRLSWTGNRFPPKLARATLNHSGRKRLSLQPFSCIVRARTGTSLNRQSSTCSRSKRFRTVQNSREKISTASSRSICRFVFFST